MKAKKILKGILLCLTLILLLFIVLIWSINYHPAKKQFEKVVCLNNTPTLKPGQQIKILSWNVQYMAGKNYVFFYDLLDGSGPDERPSTEDISKTFTEVARIILDENPDIILLQEMDEGSKRTDYENQLERFLKLLPDEYSCYTSTFYHKSLFVPHSRIMGAVGLKLATISKYKITKAIRHQLPLMEADILTKQFNFRRAVLEVRLPIEGTKDLAVLNTHFDAFAQGSTTMKKQVKKVELILENLNQKNHPWLIGGDFNLLAPGKTYTQLPKETQAYYNENTELESIFLNYKSVPGLKEINGTESEKWFTHFPNNPKIKKPDRTIDFIFYGNNIQLGNHYIRRADTLKISDHLPVLAEFKL